MTDVGKGIVGDTVLDDPFGGGRGAVERAKLAAGLDDTRTWVDPNGYRLSDRLWRAGLADRKQVDDILRHGLATGQSGVQVAEKLKDLLTPYGRQQRTRTPYGGLGNAAARTLARTEMTRAFGKATLDAAKRNPFVQGVQWRLSGSHPKIDVCNGNAERGSRGLEHLGRGVYEPNDVPRYPAHPNCFPAGTLVSGPPVTASSERWFAGYLIHIVAEGGHDLAATENHPILTRRGWIPAGMIEEGDDLIGGIFREWGAAPINPDDEQPVARIEDVARALGGSRGVAASVVPIAAEDFHGDGLDGQVCVIRADGLLLVNREAALAQPSGEQRLGRAHTDLFSLSRTGAVAQLSVGACHTAHGIMGSPRPSLPLLGRGVGMLERLGRCHVADSHAGAPDGPVYSQRCDAVAAGYSRGAFAGLIVAHHRVMHITRESFAGHVYNLQTSVGWYIANGIVVHNCLCYLVPVADPRPIDEIVAEIRRNEGIA